MAEVNACIDAEAESEELVDQPEIVRGTVRVTGPFTMEGVIAREEGPDTPIGGAPEELEAFGAEEAGVAVANAEAHLDKVLRLLKATGVDFAGNKKMKFTEMEPVTSPTRIHAEGHWENGANTARRVGVSIGPEAGNVSSPQVEEAVRAANRAGYDDLVFAGFGFDSAAQEAIEDSSHPKLRLHIALINPDVAMDDLLRTQPGSQIFTVFSAPRVEGPIPRGDGRYTLAVEGMDVYDPVKSTLHPTDKSRIAAWFLDTDYDGRTFCICQAFFPDKKKWSKLAKALGDAGMVERGAFQALSGLEILCSPYLEPDRHWLYDTATGLPSKMNGRREASYWFKSQKTGSRQQTLLAEEERDDLPLVNALRADVERWRTANWPGVSATTRKLLRHWRRDDRPRRLFFCQLEAVETILYLREVLALGKRTR